MKKRILSLLLALVMVLVLVPTVALAEDTPAMSGTCGASGNENNVKWELTDVDGDGNYTLTISGTGAGRVSLGKAMRIRSQDLWLKTA